MPQNSLQDLRDDWEIGDPVLVEFRAASGITSLRAGRITDKESMFATVTLENHNGKAKVQYKRLRRVARPPRPAPRPDPVHPVQFEAPLLRSVPPALAMLAETLATSTEEVKVETKAEPEQQLVKLPPRTKTEPQAPPEILDIKAWLEMSQKVLAILVSKQADLTAEHELLTEQAKQKLLEVEAAQADVEAFRKLRTFIAQVRPNIPLAAIQLKMSSD